MKTKAEKIIEEPTFIPVKVTSVLDNPDEINIIIDGLDDLIDDVDNDELILDTITLQFIKEIHRELSQFKTNSI